MAAETGHHPNRWYVDQDGNVHLNGCSFFNDAEEDIAARLEELGGSSLTLDTLAFSGATGACEITLTDNLADALSVKVAGGADLMVFTTTNSSETLSVLPTITQKWSIWGATAIAQPASAAQAAVTPSTDFTGADTVSKATVLAAVQACETLCNRMRLDLVNLGWIKGAA